MVEYNIVKHCGLCKKRYVINRKDAKKNYCDDCQIKINKGVKKE